jgi:hypothetical protein
MSHIIVSGNPVNGLWFNGPFEDHEDAALYAEREIKLDWWVAELLPLEGRAVDEGRLWLINSQIEGLMDSDGSSEDHQDVQDFLQLVGLNESNTLALHEAMCCYRGWHSLYDSMAPKPPINEPVEFYTDDLRNPAQRWIGVFTGDGWFSCGIEVFNITHWRHLSPNPGAGA